ncbi:MAG: NAD(+)/NADH kinase, partial [Oryzihumus sp.]
MSYTIGLVVHSGRPAAVAAAQTVREWSQHHGIRCTEIDVWSSDNDGGRFHASEEAARAGHPDLIVTIGGDGTLLRGVRVAAPIGGVVLGVNVGRVGFLTEVGTDGLA